MKFIDNIKKNGTILTYDIEGEIELLTKLDKNKPSTRIIRTKRGRTAIAALKNIELNHNHSWYNELKRISIKSPDALALFYRGTKISFAEMFEKADQLAMSLAKMGVKTGDEIPACLSNVPEMVYFLLAANKIGAKVNLFGDHYDKKFIEQILKECSKKVIFATDDVYKNIKSIVKKVGLDNKVIISLADSLPEKPELCDEYEKDLDKYYHYENKVNDYKKDDETLMSYQECVDYGKNYEFDIIDANNLDTEFLITYTSGSTKIGFPKAIVHTNRSLITCGVFHDPKLSGTPHIEGLRGLAHIHTDSNTNIITCISDNLMQTWSVALEPIYDKDAFLDVLFLNKPNYCNATTSFIINASKQYMLDKKFNNRKLPWLLALFAVGEGTSRGEEKFINTWLRKSRAGSGVKMMGVCLPFVSLSIGGGDTEHGGIYYSLWKNLYEKMYSFKLKKEEYGMMPVPYAHVSVFKPNIDGTYSECDYNEVGLIASNSVTTTRGYKNNKEATLKMVIKEDNNREWISNNVYGYIDTLGTVHVKDRYENNIKLSDDLIIPNYVIADVVTKDTKNILSCSVTKVITEYGEIPVINLELQPYKKQSDIAIIESIKDRLIAELPVGVIANAVFRIFDTQKSFPLTGSGKRSIAEIEKMGLSNTFKLINNSIEHTDNLYDEKKLKLKK